MLIYLYLISIYVQESLFKVGPSNPDFSLPTRGGDLNLGFEVDTYVITDQIELCFHRCIRYTSIRRCSSLCRGNRTKLDFSYDNESIFFKQRDTPFEKNCDSQHLFIVNSHLCIQLHQVHSIHISGIYRS